MYPIKKFNLGELKEIKKNQAKSVGKPLMYWLFTEPLCNLLQRYIPVGVNPNLITWVGWFSVLSGLLLTLFVNNSLYLPQLSKKEVLLDRNVISSMPYLAKLLPLYNAVSILIYLITDSIDGIHARKSNQCSVLGKVLDHFIDSTVAFAVIVSLFSSLKLSFSWLFVKIIFTTCLGFYFAEIFEKFNHFMRFEFISGCSEGLYLVILIHLTHFFKPDLVKKYIKEYVFSQGTKSFYIDFNFFINIYILLYVFYFVFDLVYEIYKHNPGFNKKELLLSISRAFVSSLFVVPMAFVDLPLNRAVLNNELFYIRRNSQDSTLIYSHEFFSLKTRAIFYILSCSLNYSICYLEEFMSAVSNSKASHKPIVFSSMLMILSAVNYVFIENSRISAILGILSIAHYLIRAFSTLCALSKNLDVNLFRTRVKVHKK